MVKNERFEVNKRIRFPENSMNLTHSHSFYELVYISSGECFLEINNKELNLESGMLMLLYPDNPHRTRYENTTGTERIVVEFSKDYLKGIAASIGYDKFDALFLGNPLTLPNKYYPMLEHFLNQLMKEKNQPDIYSECLISSYFQQIILLIMRFGNKVKINMEQSYLSHTVNDKTIRAAMEYIENNYSSDITLNEVAGHLHLNPSYFSKKFKTVTGIGFKDYLNSIRISHSEKLLLETNYSMTQIALECGFETSNYFGNAFRRIKGVSPRHFRKMKGNI